VNVDAAVKKAQEQKIIPRRKGDNSSADLSSLPGDMNQTESSDLRLSAVTRKGSSNSSAIEIPLQSGWNFISLPSLPGSGKTSQDIFQGINTDGHTIWKYDAVKQDWIGVEKGTDFTPLEGFLVYSDRKTGLPLVLDSGNLQHELNVSKGWNLIGTPGMSSVTAKRSLQSLSDNWVSLLPFNNTIQSYDPAIIPGANGTHSDSRSLPPFSSFWVYLNKAGVFQYAG
jgi:hypothetical protein